MVFAVVSAQDAKSDIKMLQQAASEGVSSLRLVKTATVRDKQDTDILQSIVSDEAFATQLYEKIAANDAAGAQAAIQRRFRGANVTVKSARRLDGVVSWTNCSEQTAATGETVMECTTTCVSILKRCNGRFFGRATGVSVF
jgi:hypothetical protein